MKTETKSRNMEGKKVLITGITGQDGSYLAELLLNKGYEVHGVIRRASTFNTSRIDHLYTDSHTLNTRMFLHYGDLSDMGNITKIVYDIKPDEIYNLGSQSHVRISFDIPEYTANITGIGTLRLLEAIRALKEQINNEIKFFQASSSEMFGSADPPQNEKTPFKPRSPYACAKVFSYHTTINYREAYNMYAVNGILFNHESPRRGETFVTKKITRGLARILAKLDHKIYLGNLNARRDWGYAPEYMEAVWQMMQQENPDDYVIGTGESHSVKEFLEEAFRYCGIENWEDYINIDKRYFRPSEVDNLVADYSKAKKKLRWEPKTKFKELVHIMVDADLIKCGLRPGDYH